MKAAAWFLGRFLLFSLFLSVLYWFHVDALNVVFTKLVDWHWRFGPLHYELAPNPAKLDHIQVFIVQGANRQFYSEFDSKPFHFNFIPLVALFLATPNVTLRRKALYCALGIVVIFPTQMMHIYFNLVEITTIELPLRNWSFAVWFSDVSRWFYYKSLRTGSVFMKQTGTVFVPFIVWSVFYFENFRFIFYPIARIRRYIEEAPTAESAAP